MRYYKNYWKNCFNFRDRTSRVGFWVPWLISFGINCVLAFAADAGGASYASMTEALRAGTSPFAHVTLLGTVFLTIRVLWDCANIIPYISIFVRRLHDVGRSWKVILFSIVPLFVGYAILLINPSLAPLALPVLLVALVGAIALLVFIFSATKPYFANRYFHRPQV